MQGLDDWYRDDAPDNVDILNVIVENNAGEPTTRGEAEAWRDTLDLSFTVLADPQQAWSDVWAKRGDRHTYSVIDVDGTVLLHLYGSTATTKDKLIEAATAE